MKSLWCFLGALLVIFPMSNLQAQSQKPSHIAGQGREKKKCTDCVATDFPGADSFKNSYCTAPTFCRSGNPSLLAMLANDQCRAANPDNCNGDCGSDNECLGIYDRRRSNGITVTANVDATKTCKNRQQVWCDVTLNVGAGGLLACKCSCNPK